MTHVTADRAAAVERAVRGLTDRAAAVIAWCLAVTPDGYGAGRTDGPTSNDPARSPTASAALAARRLTVRGRGEMDVRDLVWHLDAYLAAIAADLAAVADLCAAVPLEAWGRQAADFDASKRAARCDGWPAAEALCEELAGKRTWVDGVQRHLCGRCYQRMWRSTTPAGDNHRRTA